MGEHEPLPLMMRPDGNRRVIAWVSDLHTLSVYALCPRNFLTIEGVQLTPTKYQQDLISYWEAFCSKADDLQVDTVCIVGDVNDGQNWKQRGVQLMTTNLDDQVEASVDLLLPLCHNRRVYFWSGSSYHIATVGHNTEKDVCDHKRLAAVAKITRWMGPISNMVFPPSEKVWNIQHGVSSSFIYRTMLMDREQLFLSEAETMFKIPKIDCLVRGHWHNFIHLHKNQRHGIQLPCWEMYRPWKGSLLSYGKMQPDIGGVITIIDKEDRIDVWHYLYPLPMAVGEVENG